VTEAFILLKTLGFATDEANLCKQKPNLSRPFKRRLLVPQTSILTSQFNQRVCLTARLSNEPAIATTLRSPVCGSCPG
jgi:hypothetical protein